MVVPEVGNSGMGGALRSATSGAAGCGGSGRSAGAGGCWAPEGCPCVPGSGTNRRERVPPGPCAGAALPGAVSRGAAPARA